YPLDEGLAFRRQRGVDGAAVGGARAALDEAALGQPVDQVRHPAARDEDLALELAEEERALVVEGLKDGELSDGQPVACDVGPRVRRDRVVGAGQHGPELEAAVCGPVPSSDLAVATHLSAKIIRARGECQARDRASHLRNRPRGMVLRTSPFSTQARRAWSTP